MNVIVLTSDLETRFWQRVRKSRGCWEWTGTKTGFGYGHIKQRGKRLIAHRVSWLLAGHTIPRRLFVLHRCGNPACVRPSHLYAGTQKQNMADRDRHGRTPRGDQHWTHLNPECLARGNRNGARLYPERLWRGSRHLDAKLTAQQVRAIRRRAEAGTSLSQLAREYPVTVSTIHRIVHRLNWKHI